MRKGKKRHQRGGPPELFVIEGNDFPNSFIVELWHRPPKGKRELVGSRRYEPAAVNGSSPAGAVAQEVRPPSEATPGTRRPVSASTVAPKRPRRPRPPA